MAKQKAFVGNDGVAHNNAYFRPVQVHLDLVNKTASVQFFGYANKAARDGNKAPVQGTERFRYHAEGADFETYFGTSVMDQAGKNSVSQAYLLAQNTKTEPAPTVEEPDRKVSFFEGAADV